MSPQDPLTKGHAAASDAAAVHGQPPAPVAPAVIDRGAERKRRKREDAAGAGVAGTAARPAEMDVAADDDDGGDTDGARRHQDRRPRAPASERTESGSGKHGHGATVVIGGRHRLHQAAAAAAAAGSYSTGGGSSYYASAHAAAASSSAPRLLREPPDASPSPRQHKTAKPHGPRTAASAYSAAADGVPARGSGRHEPPTVTARANGVVIGGRHRRHQSAAGSSSGGGSAYADHDAAAPSSSSRLIRDPAAAAPHHHHLPKPPKAHGAPSSSASASAAQRDPRPSDPDPELCYRLGLEAAMMMGKAALRDEVNAFAGVKGQGHQRRQQQPAPEAVETKRFSFWLTDDERKADLAAVYKKLKKAPSAATAGNGKRCRQH